MDCHALLQGIFPTQGLNPGLLHSRQILYCLSHQGSSRVLEWVAYPFFTGFSQPTNWTGLSCIAGRFFTSWATRELFHINCALRARGEKARGSLLRANTKPGAYCSDGLILAGSQVHFKAVSPVCPRTSHLSWLNMGGPGLLLLRGGSGNSFLLLTSLSSRLSCLCHCCCYSVAKLCPSLCDFMDCSTSLLLNPTFFTCYYCKWNYYYCKCYYCSFKRALV